MPLPRRRRVAAALAAALVVDAGIALVFLAPAGASHPRAAAAGTEQTEQEAVARLEIIEPSVSVRREGSDEFKPARDNQKLRVGDTVQTDATGFAQVNYTDDEQSFTRLDVNTTFTIESLVDEEGNRKIKGTVETGQTWNRTSALTETESFEQEGAGATAAVTGTAFLVSCASQPAEDPAAAPLQVCTFTSVVHGITITSIDGEVQELDPLEACDSTEITESDANLCAETEQVTLDAILANNFLIENLYLDGIAGLEGIVIVDEEGNVTFTPTETASTPPEETEETPPAGPTADPPVIDPNPVNVTSYGSDNPDGHTTGGNTRVISQDERSDVTFVLQAANPGHTIFYVFTVLPDSTVGTLFVNGGPAVTINTQYAENTVFSFNPVEIEPFCTATVNFSDCFTTGYHDGASPTPYPTGANQPVDNGSGTVSWFSSFTFFAVNELDEESATQTVTLEVVDDHCNEGSRTADAVVSDCPVTLVAESDAGTPAATTPAPAETAPAPTPAPEEVASDPVEEPAPTT